LSDATCISILLRVEALFMHVSSIFFICFFNG